MNGVSGPRKRRVGHVATAQSFTATLLPRLDFDLTVGGGAEVVVLERGEEVIEVRGLPPAAARTALAEMRGDRDLREISLVSRLPPHEVKVLCERLAAAGVLTFLQPGHDGTGPSEVLAPGVLVDACERHFATWKTRLFEGPLWTGLASGAAERPVFLGWLIESYFFIEAVTARLPVAIAGSRDPAVRRLFAKHYSEEYDHHHFFRKSLAAAGVDPETLADRTPLPGTLAVRNHMRDCGRRDPLAYATCSGFLESTGDDHARSHAFFDRLASHYDQGQAPVVTPMADHARLDEGYEHCGMLRLVAEAIGPVTRTRAEAALEAVRILVETLDVWSADILRHYRDERALPGGVRRYRPLNYGVSTGA